VSESVMAAKYINTDRFMNLTYIDVHRNVLDYISMCVKLKEQWSTVSNSVTLVAKATVFYVCKEVLNIYIKKFY